MKANKGQLRPIKAKILKPFYFITRLCKIINKWECDNEKVMF